MYCSSTKQLLGLKTKDRSHATLKGPYPGPCKLNNRFENSHGTLYHGVELDEQLFVGTSLGLSQVSPNGRALVPSVALANSSKSWSLMSNYLWELAWACPRCRKTGAL